MDLKRGLTFPTLDPQWIVKVLIGTLISFIPILNFVGIGYSLDVTRNVSHGQETPLPEWNDFGGQFIRGFLAVIIQLLWALPLLVLSCPLLLVFVASLDPETGQVSGGGGVLLACLPFLILIGAVALSPFFMAATTRFAITNQFSEAMPGPVIREVRGNFRPLAHDPRGRDRRGGAGRRDPVLHLWPRLAADYSADLLHATGHGALVRAGAPAVHGWSCHAAKHGIVLAEGNGRSGHAVDERYRAGADHYRRP
jgi:hypothetical protein